MLWNVIETAVKKTVRWTVFRRGVSASAEATGPEIGPKHNVPTMLTTNDIDAAITSSVVVKLSSPAEDIFIIKLRIEVTYENPYLPPLISENGAPPSIL